MANKLPPVELAEKWEQYCRMCDAHTQQQRFRNEVLTVSKPIIYTMEGFCLFAGINEIDLPRYEKNKNFNVVMRRIKHAVLARKLEALLNGEGNAAGLIFDLKANHGLHIKKVNKDVMQDYNITLDLGDGNLQQYKGRKAVKPRRSLSQ